jgi:hypothetical protein
MKSVRVAMVLAAGVIVASVSAQGPMREGRWETTMQMQMAGMTMAPTKTASCITKEQLKDPSKTVPSSAPGCTISDYRVTGTKTTWKTVCKDMEGTGEMVFKGDTYEGQIVVTMPHQMTMKISGKRLGDCTQ